MSFASGPGTTAANILGIGVGARAIGMGEAYTAMADDISSLYWNPAGVALLSQSEASFMYNQSYQGMTYNNAGVGVSLENGGIGGSLSYLGFGDIDGYDNLGNATGNVDAYSGVATVGGGLLLDAFTVGVNLKAVQGSLADEKATGAAFDMGATYVVPQPILGGSTLRLGATVRNLGTGLTFIQQKDPFPTEYRMGAALLQLYHQKLNLALDYGIARGYDGVFYAGSEFWLSKFLALRAGYTGADTESNGLRAGIGLRVKDLSFDYAYASFGDLGMTHRYELTYRFGEIRTRLTPEMRKMLRQARRCIREHRYGEALLLLDSLVQMDPKYKTFTRLYKVAMRGDERQEKFASSQKSFSLLAPQNANAKGTLSDLDDIEQLLNESDSSTAQAAQPKKLNKERKN